MVGHISASAAAIFGVVAVQRHRDFAAKSGHVRTVLGIGISNFADGDERGHRRGLFGVGAARTSGAALGLRSGDAMDFGIERRGFSQWRQPVGNIVWGLHSAILYPCHFWRFRSPSTPPWLHRWNAE